MYLSMSIFAANIQYFYQLFFSFIKKHYLCSQICVFTLKMASRTIKEINRGIASLLFGMCLTICSAENNGISFKPDKTIVILYENDVHCDIDG